MTIEVANLEFKSEQYFVLLVEYCLFKFILEVFRDLYLLKG